ncbi:hypothetical protein D3C78_1724870 [compost metagenome]
MRSGLCLRAAYASRAKVNKASASQPSIMVKVSCVRGRAAGAGCNCVGSRRHCAHYDAAVVRVAHADGIWAAISDES